jgi:hypothetical protein
MAILGQVQNATSVTPNDTLGLSGPTAFISVGVAGTISVDMYGGQKNIQLTLPAGFFPLAVTKVYNTGTSATGICAYW